MSPVLVDNYDAIVAAINRKYETALVHRGSEVLDLESTSTGSPELDIAMGGGVPDGRWTRFYGGFGSTKTMSALTTIGNAQKRHLKCAYYNVEKRYEEGFAKKLGVDTEDLAVVEGTTIEEIGDKMESLLGVVHFHVIDSCSIAVSEDELNADIRDWRPGINARAWGKTFRRLNERFDINENTAIIIDQMRVNFKTQGEDPAGGKVFDHQSSMSVLFRKSGWMWRDKDGVLVVPSSTKTAKRETGTDDQVVPAGQEIKIRVEKSSVCRPFRTATLHYDLDTLEYDRLYEYSKAARYYGVVETHGSWYWYQPNKNKEPIKLQGEKQLREFIATNKILQKTIHKIALNSALR